MGRKLGENPLCLRPDATTLAEAPPCIMLRGACELELIKKSLHTRTHLHFEVLTGFHALQIDERQSLEYISTTRLTDISAQPVAYQHVQQPLGNEGSDYDHLVEKHGKILT